MTKITGYDTIWPLLFFLGILIPVAGFLIRNWMNSIKSELLEQNKEFKILQTKVQDQIHDINLEAGKRKGEVELLKKDVEKLASDTLNNFDNLKLHLSYQKSSLEEIKKDGKERMLDMDNNFKKVIELIGRK